MNADAGSGKMSSSPLSRASKTARATDSGDAFGDVDALEHVGVDGAG
jgi:hypothetical protein